MQKLEIVLSLKVRNHQEYEYKPFATKAVSKIQDFGEFNCSVRAYVKVDDIIKFVIVRVADDGTLWTYDVDRDFVYMNEEEIPFYVYMLLENVDGQHRCITR